MRLNAHYTAQLIKSRRKQLNISQVDLSKNIGWSNKNAQYISNIERGLCPFPPDYVNQLSCALMLPRETIIESMTLDYKYALNKEVFNGTKAQ